MEKNRGLHTGITVLSATEQIWHTVLPNLVGGMYRLLHIGIYKRYRSSLHELDGRHARTVEEEI